MKENITHLLKLFSKVVIKPGVEEGVVARRRHSESVHHEESEVIVLPSTSRNVDVVQEIYEIQGKPGHTKYRHHRDQHPVRPSFPVSIRFLLLGVLGARLAASPVV